MHSKVKTGFRMSKWDVRPEFECNNWNCYIRPNSNDKIGYQTSKCDNPPDFESQNRIIRYLAQVLLPNSNMNVGFQVSKCDIRPQFECQNMISNVKMRYSARIKWQNGFRMSKCDICHKFESQNKILNVKMRYSALIRMLKLEFECQNEIFGPNSNVKLGIRMSKWDIGHIRMLK